MFKSDAAQVQEFENVVMAGRYSLMLSYQKIPYGISSYKTIRMQHRYYAAGSQSFAFWLRKWTGKP